MIDPNCTQNEIQPSFSQNAQSFIKARSIDNRLFFWCSIVRANVSERRTCAALRHWRGIGLFNAALTDPLHARRHDHRMVIT
jgi:hypothetical protein